MNVKAYDISVSLSVLLRKAIKNITKFRTSAKINANNIFLLYIRLTKLLIINNKSNLSYALNANMPKMFCLISE